MKYLKHFESIEFDIDFAISKIKEQFSDDTICNMLDEEILEWVDSDWIEEYESEHDWYVDHNNREAEDIVIEQIITWYENKYGHLNERDKLLLIDKLIDIYNCL
jgi:hypothetical protein